MFLQVKKFLEQCFAFRLLAVLIYLFGEVLQKSLFLDVLEDFIMKHVAHLDYFSTLQSTNAIGLVTSMVANKLLK